MLGPQTPSRLSNRESPSKRSPSLKRERTNYRTDMCGYRTIRTYETPVKQQSSRFEATAQVSSNQYANEAYSPIRNKSRSRSPRVKSELTDYRAELNYRTVKNYETPTKTSSNDIARQNFRDFNFERLPMTKRSPGLKAEPTVYREETNYYRRVRVYDHTLHSDDHEAVQSSQKGEYESEVKRPQEKGEKKDAGNVAKKLEFEQQETKSGKAEGRQATQARASSSSARKGKSQQCQFKTHEEQFLVRSLNHVVNYDKKLENQKNILASCLDFTMQGAFKKLVNENGKDGGNKAQFEENIRNLGIFFTQSELDSVFKRFDADGDGKISYHEFENVIYPVSLPYARMIRLRIDEQPLSNETLGLLIDFVKLIGSIEGSIEDLRTKISKRVSLDEAFRALDNREKGSIEIYEFKKMLENHGFCPETNDIAALKHRVDLNEDGYVDNGEFTVSMSPTKGGK